MERQKQANFCVVQDCRLPRGVFLDAIRAKWRIDGDGNRSGEKNPGVRYEESSRSRQHHRYAPACRHSTPRQLRGAPVPSGVELAERKRRTAFASLTILGGPGGGTL